MAMKTNLEAILERSGNFVVVTKGHWDHKGWEEYLGSLSDLNLKLNDETKRHLGNILESSKFLFLNGGAHHAVSAKATAKPKAAAKPKASAKSAAKPKAAPKK